MLCYLDRHKHDCDKACCFIPEFSKLGNLFDLENKKIQELVNKYFSTADPDPGDIVIKEKMTMKQCSRAEVCRCFL